MTCEDKVAGGIASDGGVGVTVTVNGGERVEFTVDTSTCGG